MPTPLESKIFICGTVRNCEPHLDSVFVNIDSVTTLFVDYHIIIAFDESNDKSLLKLARQKQKYGDKMDILVNRNPLSQIRTQNISNARNAILNKIRERISGGFNIEEWQYFAMMDMDDVCSKPIQLDALRGVMDRADQWDSVSFNRSAYYDLWALSIDKYVYSCWGWLSPWEVVEHMRKYIVDKLSKIPADQFVECRSAFNGFAVYRTLKFLDCYYDWRIPKQYMTLEELEENRRVLWNVGSRSPLNVQTDEPDCEHRTFHMMATAKNGARIRICPGCLF
jgi:glycosyltransferase involved in cell wall biosynthesis